MNKTCSNIKIRFQILSLDKRQRNLSNLNNKIDKLSNRLGKFSKNEINDYKEHLAIDWELIKFKHQMLEISKDWAEFREKQKQLQKQVNKLYRDYIRLAHIKSIKSDIYWLILVALTTIIISISVLLNMNNGPICEIYGLFFAIIALTSSIIAILEDIKINKKQIKCILQRHNSSIEEYDKIISDFMNQNPNILKETLIIEKQKSR